MSRYSYSEIADRWRQYGKDYAVNKWAWDGSCVLATLGPDDGGLRARDFSGRNNHGTLTNGPTWQNATMRGGAFRAVGFDGSDDYVQFSLPMSSAETRWSIATTIGTVDPLGISRCILGEVVSGSLSVAFQRGSGRSVWCYIGSNSNYVGGLATADNAWVNLIATYDAASTPKLKFYVNNTEATTYSGTLPSSVDLRTIGLGKDLGITTFSAWLGRMASTAIYRRVLSPAEIHQFTTHPLAAYEVRLPNRFVFAGISRGSPWLYHVTRRRLQGA